MDIYYGENRDDNFLTISTDGRSFWRSLLYGSVSQNPEDNFIHDKTSILTNNEIIFENTSLESAVGSFKWYFAGGTPSVSYEKNTKRVYLSPGVYQAKLEVLNSAGSDTKTSSIEVKNIFTSVVNMSDKGDEKNFVFYSGTSEVSIDMFLTEVSKVELYDLRGSLIQIKEIYHGKNRIPIKKGLYVA